MTDTGNNLFTLNGNDKNATGIAHAVGEQSGIPWIHHDDVGILQRPSFLINEAPDEAAFSDLSDYTEQISKWKSGTLTYSDEAEASDVPTEAELAAMSEAERRDYQMQKAYSDWVLDVNGKRNTEMANSVLRAMQEGKKLMAVAGIAHFLIDNSILDILKQSGCTVAAYP